MTEGAGIMLIDIPNDVQSILKTLNENSYEAYIVGGCVRDKVLGMNPKDWDIATNAKPDEIKQLFTKTVDTGIKHGTVTIVIDSNNYEATTYRIDGQYSDNRRPDNVEFTSSLDEDLSRRDFTMNAMAYHPLTGLYDPFKGMEDIEKRIIRAVGNPKIRFEEDALRMLRAVRFSAQLDFEIDEDSLNAIKNQNSLISIVSQERIRDELTKILISQNPEKFDILMDTGLLEYVLPEFEACYETEQNNPHHIYNVAKHIIVSLEHIENLPVLRWTMLLHDIGKPFAKTIDKNGIGHFYGHPELSESLALNILKRLRFDNKSIITITRLIKHHDRALETTESSVRKAIFSVGEDIFPYLLKVMKADIMAQNPVYQTKKLETLHKIITIYDESLLEQQFLSLKNLAINGDDLKALGVVPGKQIGQILDLLLEMILDNPELNNREDLLNLSLLYLKSNKEENEV